MPFLYDFFGALALESPTPTLQWFPHTVAPGLNATARTSTHRLLLGTHHARGAPSATSTQLPAAEQLLLAECDLPTGPFTRPSIVPAHAALTPVLSSVVFNTINDGAPQRFRVRADSAVRHYNPTEPQPAYAELGVARLNPHNAAQAAAFATHGDIVVYSLDGGTPASRQSAAHRVLVGGHGEPGDTLDWSPSAAGTLVSGARDGSVALWDVNANPAVPPVRGVASYGNSNRNSRRSVNAPVPIVQPVAVAERLHAAAVTEVAWNPHIPPVFGTASADGSLCIVDTRINIRDPVARVSNAHASQVGGGSNSNSNGPPKGKGEEERASARATRSSAKSTPEPGQASKRGGASSGPANGLVQLATAQAQALAQPEYEAGAVNSLAFNPHNEYALATAGSDGAVHVWDMRILGGTRAVAALRGHHAGGAGDAVAVRWSPQHGSVLASGGGDRRVLVWDLARLGTEDQQTAEEAEDGPPELLFVHGGHAARVVDVQWHPELPWVLASAAEDNVVQVWKAADHITAVHEHMYESADGEEEDEE